MVKHLQNLFQKKKIDINYSPNIVFCFFNFDKVYCFNNDLLLYFIVFGYVDRFTFKSALYACRSCLKIQMARSRGLCTLV